MYCIKFFQLTIFLCVSSLYGAIKRAYLKMMYTKYVVEADKKKN